MQTTTTPQTTEAADSAPRTEPFESARRNRWWYVGGAAVVAFAIVAGVLTGLTLASDDAAADDEALATTTTTLPETPTTTVAETAEPVEVPPTPVPIDPAPEDQQPPAEEPAEEPEPQPEPEPAPPAPAKLSVPEAVDVGDDGEGVFSITNTGEEELTDIEWLAPSTLGFDGMPDTVGPGESVEVGIAVDTSGFDPGDYEVAFLLGSSGGAAQITVTGTKSFIVVLPLAADVEIAQPILVPHLQIGALITITNNEDHPVTIDLTSNHGRLSLPAQYIAPPGESVLVGGVAHMGALAPAAVMELTFDATWSWGGGGTFSILKFGQ